jgi:hypothetical protein
MADIDRVIAKQGSGPAPVPASGGARVPAPVAPGPVRKRSVALTWFWALLAVALAIALLLWPYPRVCGLQLIYDLGAAGITALIAILGALASWSHHRGLAHVISLLVLLWAGFVALREVLPRVGYARTSLAWLCTTEPAAPARGTPGPGAPTGTRPAPGADATPR